MVLKFAWLLSETWVSSKIISAFMMLWTILTEFGTEDEVDAWSTEFEFDTEDGVDARRTWSSFCWLFWVNFRTGGGVIDTVIWMNVYQIFVIWV